MTVLMSSGTQPEKNKLKEGFVKTLKVAGFVAGSGAIAALADWSGTIDVADNGVAAVVLVGIINILAVAIKEAIKKE